MRLFAAWVFCVWECENYVNIFRPSISFTQKIFFALETFETSSPYLKATEASFDERAKFRSITPSSRALCPVASMRERVQLKILLISSRARRRANFRYHVSRFFFPARRGKEMKEIHRKWLIWYYWVARGANINLSSFPFPRHCSSSSYRSHRDLLLHGRKERDTEDSFYDDFTQLKVSSNSLNFALFII